MRTDILKRIPSDPHFQALESDLEAESGMAFTAMIAQSVSPLASKPRAPCTYNYLSFDTLTQTVSGNIEGTPFQPPTMQEFEFAQSASNIHQVFQSDPAISEIIRK